MLTLAVACRKALDAGMDRLDAQMLLLHALGKSPHDRAWLAAHDQDLLGSAGEETFGGFCQRRLAGEPLAYIVGQKAFFGLELDVDNRVLVPRPDTETLVLWALDCLASSAAAQARVLDMGTGSGAVVLALAAESKRASSAWGANTRFTASDVSEGALAVARANARKHGLEHVVAFVQSDWFGHISGCFEVIVSNPPYIENADPHLAALTHEPLQALTSGDDGLRDIRHIVTQAPHHLQPGGWLMLEHGHDQAGKVQVLLRQRGFGNIQSRMDLGGHSRCTGGQWQPLPAP